MFRRGKKINRKCGKTYNKLLKTLAKSHILPPKASRHALPQTGINKKKAEYSEDLQPQHPGSTFGNIYFQPQFFRCTYRADGETKRKKRGPFTGLTAAKPITAHFLISVDKLRAVIA